METWKAQRLLRQKMDEHGLQKMRAEINERLTNCFGRCWHDRRIELSGQLVRANNEERVLQTIMHEIAHALVGEGHGHDWVWRQKAIELGHTGQRCWNHSNTEDPNFWTEVTMNNGDEVNAGDKIVLRNAVMGHKAVTFVGFKARNHKYPLVVSLPNGKRFKLPESYYGGLLLNAKVAAESVMATKTVTEMWTEITLDNGLELNAGDKIEIVYDWEGMEMEIIVQFKHYDPQKEKLVCHSGGHGHDIEVEEADVLRIK